MQLKVMTESFNKQLEGQAVHVIGYAYEGDRVNLFGLVTEVQTDSITVLDAFGRQYRFTDEDFEGQEDPDGVILSGDEWNLKLYVMVLPDQYYADKKKAEAEAAVREQIRKEKEAAMKERQRKSFGR